MIVRDQARGVYGIDPSVSSTRGVPAVSISAAPQGGAELDLDGGDEPITSRTGSHPHKGPALVPISAGYVARVQLLQCRIQIVQALLNILV